MLVALEVPTGLGQLLVLLPAAVLAAHIPCMGVSKQCVAIGLTQ